MLFWKVRQTQSTRPETRRAAARGLAGNEAPKAVAALQDLLSDPVDDVAVTAAVSLLASGRAGLAALLEGLAAPGGRDGPAFRRVANHLAVDRDDSLVERLSAALDQGRPPARRTAVKLLAALPAAGAVHALEKALYDGDETVVTEAAEALARTGNPALAALTGALERGSLAARRSASRLLPRLRGPVVVDALARALEDADAEVRRAAARGLGELNDPTSLDALVAVLRDKSAPVAQEAAIAVGKLGDQRAAETLVKAARGLTGPGANLAVIDALGALGGERALEFLLERLEHPDPKLVTAAARALGSFTDPRACDALINKLEHGHDAVRGAVAQSLGRIANPMAATGLTLALDRARRRGSSDEKEIAEALTRLHRPA